MTPMLKSHPLINIMNNTVVDLPSPRRISYWWNFGSLLGLCLAIQLIRGILLSIHYGGDILIAFDSVRHIRRDVNFG